MKYIVRAQELNDIDMIHQIRIDPRNTKQIVSTPYESLDVFKQKILNNSQESVKSLVCVDVETKKVVGNCALKLETNYRLNHTASIAILVDANFQGNGIGSIMMESMIDLGFNYFKLRRIELMVNVDNQSAINLYKKFGFEIEGTLKDFTKYDNGYHDGYIMSLINYDN